MIKDRFLKPFEEFSDSITDKDVKINFINSANDDELREIGLSILCLFPSQIRRQIGNRHRSDIDYSFIEDYTSTYSIDRELKTKDKACAGKLYNQLMDNHGLTAIDFLSTGK